MTKYALVALVALAAVSQSGWAHEDHNHEAAVEAAPRGGILRNAPPYKAELVLNKDQVKLFVYDDKLKAIPKEKLKPAIKGDVSFPKDKKKRDVTFQLKGDAYEAKIAGIDKVHRYDMHVTLEVDGKPVVADFGVDNIH